MAAPEPGVAGKVILVAEDDDDTRAWLVETLGRAGYRVLPAADGKEALELLRRGPPPDLVLLDMLMPVLDGWAFLRRLREAGPPLPPVVVATATILTREWAASNGCGGFLHKPIQPGPLLAEVRRCLGRGI